MRKKVENCLKLYALKDKRSGVDFVIIIGNQKRISAKIVEFPYYDFKKTKIRS